MVGKIAVVGKQLVGHVDNAVFPGISVDISMTLVVPAQAKGRVPVLMMFGGFGGGGLPRPAGAPSAAARGGFGPVMARGLLLRRSCCGRVGVCDD